MLGCELNVSGVKIRIIIGWDEELIAIIVQKK